jgi:DNA-binding NtrC family response regulator
MTPSILIVDDNADLAEVLAEILSAQGYRVRVASDGERGLEMMRREIPDALVLDIEMPHLTGPETADLMFLRDAGLEAVPIVLYSGLESLPEVARRVGTPYFIGKPFDVAVLLGLVRRALEERVAPTPLPHARPGGAGSEPTRPPSPRRRAP